MPQHAPLCTGPGAQSSGSVQGPRTDDEREEARSHSRPHRRAQCECWVRDYRVRVPAQVRTDDKHVEGTVPLALAVQRPVRLERAPRLGRPASQPVPAGTDLISIMLQPVSFVARLQGRIMLIAV